MNYISRTIDDFLQEWKDEDDRKPLLVRGARQVGKSWSIRHLGQTFRHYIEINLEKRKDLLPLFTSASDVKQLVSQISLLTDTPVIEGETLLFIDEIQYSPEAIGLLRFFKEDLPNLHVVAAGSLLEFALETIPSFGVGRVRSVFMYPLSFKEFLGATGHATWIKAINSASTENPLFDALHTSLVAAYRDFMIVGGMPACVAKWVETGDYLKCASIQEDIQQSYFDDFGKYSSKIDPEVLRTTLKSVVGQQGSKFTYSKVEGNYREPVIKEALRRLTQAGLIKPIKMSAANGLPLGAEVNEKFIKYIFLDTGLMLRILDMDFGIDDMKTLIVAGNAVDLVNKGSMAEMYAGWEIVKSSNPKMQHDLYYWENTAKGASAEVDFVLPYNMKILPIEVKSGTSGKMKSLRTFMESKNLNIAIRTSLENFGILNVADNHSILIIPLYALFCYKKQLERNGG